MKWFLIILAWSQGDGQIEKFYPFQDQAMCEHVLTTGKFETNALLSSEDPGISLFMCVPESSITKRKGTGDVYLFNTYPWSE